MDASITNSVIAGVSGVAAATLPPLVAYLLNKQQKSLKPVPTALQPWRWLSIVSLAIGLVAIVVSLWPREYGPYMESGCIGTVGSAGEAAKDIHIEFKKDWQGRSHFRRIPKVIIGLTCLDVYTGPAGKEVPPEPSGAPQRSTLRVGAGASNIDRDGFWVSIYTRNGGLVHGGDICWLAYEEQE